VITYRYKEDLDYVVGNPSWRPLDNSPIHWCRKQYPTLMPMAEREREIEREKQN